MRKGFLMMAAGLICLSAPTFAAITIDFEQGQVTGGTITENSTLTEAVGVNIPVDELKVTIDGTTTFYDLFGAGANSATDANPNGSALVNFDTAAGTFTIVGGVCSTAASTSCPGTNTLVASTTLANGTGASASIVTESASTLTFTESDQKASSLLTALGIPTNTQFVLMTANFNNLAFQSSNGDGTTTYTVGSVDIANTAVPEPTSVLLLGTILFGVTGLMRRRGKKA